VSARRLVVVRVVLLLPVAVALGGCTTSDEGQATAAPVTATPDAVDDLGALIVTEVPSGLPRLADGDLDPPAGAKTVDDVATYAEDPDRERGVLEDYGYRHGWERFWGAGTGEGPQTGVFVDQFEAAGGADSYAEDLARNDADHYGGLLSEGSPDLPDDCRRLLVDEPDPEDGLWGPAAFAWCTRGSFSVAVSAVAGTLDDATEEVGAVARDQLDRLPAG